MAIHEVSHAKSPEYVLLYTHDGETPTGRPTVRETRLDHPDMFWITEAGVLVVETAVTRTHDHPSMWTKVVEVLETK